MSDIRNTHPGYFSVTLGLALLWYIGLGIAFLFVDGSTLQKSETYEVIAAYIPLWVWSIIYLSVGIALLFSISIKGVSHHSVRVCCLVGLILSTFWLGLFVYSLIIGKLDLITVIPAWLLCVCVEWAAMNEPEHGPISIARADK